MQGKGWLLAGAAAAVLVIVATPSFILPVGSRWVLSAALLILGVALYFRAHWAATAKALRAQAERDADVAQRLVRLADDLERSGFVIVDNLEESRSASDGSLYLDGARAHAARLGHLVARCRGLSQRLAAEPDDAGESPGRLTPDPDGSE